MQNPAAEAVMTAQDMEAFEGEFQQDGFQQDGEENNGKPSKRQKSRHRASVACATCRERRIRVRVSIFREV